MVSRNRACAERPAPGKMRGGRVIHWAGQEVTRGQEILFPAALRAGKVGLPPEESRAPAPVPGEEKPRPSRRPEAVHFPPGAPPHSGFPSPRPTRSLTIAPISLHHPHLRRRSGSPGLPVPPRRRDYGGAGAGRQRLRSGLAPLSRPRGSPPPTAGALSPPGRPHLAPSSPVLQIHFQNLPVALKEALHIALPGLVAQAANVHPRHPGNGGSLAWPQPP